MNTRTLPLIIVINICSVLVRERKLFCKIKKFSKSFEEKSFFYINIHFHFYIIISLYNLYHFFYIGAGTSITIKSYRLKLSGKICAFELSNYYDLCVIEFRVVLPH